METLTSGVINVHVDPKDKEEATNILKDLGLNMTTLINMTLKQVIKKMEYHLKYLIQNQQKCYNKPLKKEKIF